jgi:hypothetical protein
MMPRRMYDIFIHVLFVEESIASGRVGHRSKADHGT